MDNSSYDVRFTEARARVLGETYNVGGIGSLSEKSLHRIVKLFLEPDASCHEIKHLGYVADIKNDGGITEIQTRNFSLLVPKLRAFLADTKVSVVYPLPYEKYITVIDRESGEMSERKKSPKKSRVYDAFYELYNIREFVSHPNFSLILLFLNVDEYRYNGGKVLGRLRKSVRAERIPNSVEKIIEFRNPEDYLLMLPDELPDEFCAADFNRAVGKRFKHAYSGIRILSEIGLLSEGERVGKKVIYKRIYPRSQ